MVIIATVSLLLEFLLKSTSRRLAGLLAPYHLAQLEGGYEMSLPRSSREGSMYGEIILFVPLSSNTTRRLKTYSWEDLVTHLRMAGGSV